MRFSYQARTSAGELQRGTVEARDEEAAIATLRRHNLVIVGLSTTEGRSLYDRPLTLWRPRIKKKDIALFYRQLSTLFEAGVAVVEALEVLRQQAAHPRLNDVLFALETDVRAGLSLSKAMAKHEDIFTALYVNIAKSGEETGRLGEVLGHLADHAEREYLVESKVKGAMTYPLVVISLFVIVGALMMVFVVPQLTSILVESGQELPMVTRLLIFVSDLLRNWGVFVLLGLIALGYGGWRWLRTEEGSATWDFWKLRVPIFGRLLRNIYLGRFVENFATLLRGELPILQALSVTADVVGNAVYRDIILEARDRVRAGDTVSSVLERYEEFPPILVQMVRVGERSAKVSEILEKIAAFYRQEVNGMIDNLTQLIEPVMIVVLGVAVGGLVAAILMPIYNLASGL